MTSAGPIGSALEERIWTALKASAEIPSVVTQPIQEEGLPYRPDFAVWLATPSKVIESPLVIEVKGVHFHAKMSHLDQMERFARVGDLRTGIVVVTEPGNQGIRVATLAPLIFVVGFDEF